MVRRTPKRNVVRSSRAGGAMDDRCKPLWFTAVLLYIAAGEFWRGCSYYSSGLLAIFQPAEYFL